MMKKALAAIMVLAILLTSAMTVSAIPQGTVGKYTPVIDGDRDAAYDQSFSFNIFDQENANKGEGWWSTYGDMDTVADANVWFLWDDAFLYAYVDVLLPQVLDRGKDFILEEDNPWEANSVELWVLWTDLDDDTERVKTSVEPLYGRTWGEGPYFDDVEPNTKKTAKLTPTGYAAEFAIAIPPAYLKDGGKVKFTLQINHFDGEGTIPVGQQIQASGDQGVDNAAVLTLGAAIAIAAPEPEPEPEPEPTEAPAVAPAVEVTPEPTAPAVVAPPQTGDNTMIFALGLLAFAGMLAYAYSKKKKI
jgi:LPXTG-motif cell wall-anchored protein